MRNTFFFGASLLTAGVGVVLAVGACSDVGTAFDSAAGSVPNAGSDDRETTAFADAGAAAPTSSLLSPLCSPAYPRCLPDDDGTFVPSAGITACAAPNDGGVDEPENESACRIGESGPSCLDGGADRKGVDGVSCSKSDDCAPGFDCIAGESKGAVCRRYCCAGSSACDDRTSQNGGRTFCDVQELEARKSAFVPVCMPMKQCTLLKSKECSASETCAVVSDKGETGCVAVGPRPEGETCEKQHCAMGLTCLGGPGDRKCYKLCRTNDNGNDGCSGAQKCTTSSLFPDTTYGVCRQ